MSGGPILGPASGHPTPKPRITLGDWSVRGIEMYARCSCGADRIVPTYTLIEKLGAGKVIRDEDLHALAKRMKCGSCKVTGQVVLRVKR